MIPIELRGVLFDYDGVLARSMEDNFLAWDEALQTHGVSLAREDFFPLEGMRLHDMARVVFDKYELSYEFLDGVLAKKELSYTRRLNNGLTELYPGVEDFIKKLNSLSIALGIVSGGRRERISRTTSSEFLNSFDTLVTADDVQKGKPHPDPYLKGAEKIRQDIKNCVVIENAPLGIKAAKAAGAYCVAIASTMDASFLQEADEVVPSFENLAKTKIFQKIL